MPWNLNFCAPFIPSDPTIEFHRLAQTALLILYFLLYLAVHSYYKFCAPKLLSHTASEKSTEKKQDGTPPSHPDQQTEKLGSDDNSDEKSDKDKEVSIKLEEQANDSCVELKKTGLTWQKTLKNTKAKKVSLEEEGPKIQENVSLQEVEHYFPIVFGHFAVAMGASVMYSPYAEQTIAAFLYMVLTVPLLLANAKRYSRVTIFFWSCTNV